MSRKPGQPTNVLWIGVGAISTAILTLGILVWFPTTRNAIEWGTAPSWVTVFAGAAAFSGVLIAYRTYALNIQHRLDDEATQARLLLHTGKITSGRGHAKGDAILKLEFRNASTKPFSIIKVTGITYNGKACTKTPIERARDRKNPLLNLLPPGDTATTVWNLPEDATGLEEEYAVTIGHTYLDSNGRRWKRLNHSEPQRIYDLPPSREKVIEFETATNQHPKASK